MEWDHERKREKEAEVQSAIKYHLREGGLDEALIDKAAQEFFENAVRLTPPEKKRVLMHMVTMAPSGRGGGRSSKAGNIKLNVRAVFDAVSGGVFTAISLTQAPLALPFAAILLWNSMWRNIQVPLSEAEAVVLWVMWQVKDSEKKVKLKDIKPSVDGHAKKYDRQTLSGADIKHALRHLHEIGCVEPVQSEADTWWLREWISPAYR